MDNQRCHAAALAEHLSRNSQRGSPSSPPLPLTPVSPGYLLPALTRKKEIQNLWLLWDEPAFTIAISFSPISTSPHTAKGRLRHLCAFLVPSLWLINYVLPQRGHREAQRFLELGLRPRPRTRSTHPQERTYGIIPACKVNEKDSPA